MTRLGVMNRIKEILTELEENEKYAKNLGMRVLIEVHTKGDEKFYTPIFIEKELS